MDNNNNKKETKDKKSSKYNKIYFITMICVFCVFSVAIFVQYQNKVELENQKNQVLEEIEKENKTTEELKKQSEYKDSDEYIEKIAREQLGLVKHNEVLFIDQNK